MNDQALRKENSAFAGTNGISQNNAQSGFKPAFLNRKNGRVEISKTENGSLAPFHLIDWLPEEWAASTRHDGSIESLIPGIISGFSRDGKFYTREETANF